MPHLGTFRTDSDPQFVYIPFRADRDFGPYDLGRVVLFCRMLKALQQEYRDRPGLIYICKDSSPQDQANSATLCAAFLVLVLGKSAEDAFLPFANERFIPFVDCRGEDAAADAIFEEVAEDFELTLLDVLRGLQFARDKGWVDHRTFDVEEHAALLEAERGDMSWLIPAKALAMASPWARPTDQDGLPVSTPSSLVPFFNQHRIKLIFQCNCPQQEEKDERRELLDYDPKPFEDAGVRHIQLAFEDGGCPSSQIILQFLGLCRETPDGFAVHCRSGLGRTATLIGAWAMRNLLMPARSFIGWCRVVRPGTVHGCQQQYLVNLEKHLLPGSLEPLELMPNRNALLLLPRRELRFWAMDCGVPPEKTRHCTNGEVVDLVIAQHFPEAQQLQGPLSGAEQLASANYRAPSPAQLKDQVSKAALDSGLAHSPAPPQVSSSTSATGAADVGTQSPVRFQSSASSASSSTVVLEGQARDHEWDEVFSYLTLLTSNNALQAEGWKMVRQRAEVLRQRSRQTSAADSSHEDSEMEATLQEVQQQVAYLLGECDKLRYQVVMEKQAQAQNRRKLQELLQVAAVEKKQDELQVAAMVQRRDELLSAVVAGGYVEQWQARKISDLQQQLHCLRERKHGEAQ